MLLAEQNPVQRIRPFSEWHLELGRALTALAAGATKVSAVRELLSQGTGNLYVLHEWHSCHQRLLLHAMARVALMPPHLHLSVPWQPQLLAPFSSQDAMKAVCIYMSFYISTWQHSLLPGCPKGKRVLMALCWLSSCS